MLRNNSSYICCIYGTLNNIIFGTKPNIGKFYVPPFFAFFRYWLSAKDYVREHDVYKIRDFFKVSQAAKTDYSRVHQKKSPVFNAAIITDCFE
jgi:hypothetical protein